MSSVCACARADGEEVKLRRPVPIEPVRGHGRKK